jgi:transcription elongation factor GreA
LLSLDDSLDLSVYSPQSPVGSAVLGGKVGDDISYEAPNGKQISITIVAIEGFSA